MKLNVRAGDSVVVLGRIRKIIQISELSSNEKLKMGIPTQTIVRRLTLEDKSDLIFLN